MSTATDKDTRLFRFGAIVPEKHQELALRLAELEDRLNAAFAVEEEPWQPIYFIPAIVDDLSDAPVEVEQAEGHFSIRLEALPAYDDIIQSFLDILEEHDIMKESRLARLKQNLDEAAEERSN